MFEYHNMNRLIRIGEAAKLLGVSVQTLRRWERSGQLLPDRKTDAGTRYYEKYKILGLDATKPTITLGYARVSSHDQKEDLARQISLLESYCSVHGWQFEIIQDSGSGMNYRKRGLKRLLNLILDNKIKRLVITHKDRLLRFGSELIFSICAICQVEVVIINQGDVTSFEEELAQDVLEIITVFSARLYGNRSHKNKKLLKTLEEFTDVSNSGNNAES